MKMSVRRSKSRGWASFNLKQQQIRGLEEEVENEPYPHISSTVVPLRPCQDLMKNNDPQARSFSSVLLPSVNFPTLVASKDIGKPLLIGTSTANQTNELIEEKQDNNGYQAYEKLKLLHSWADKKLIEDDNSEAVNNDVDKASAILKEMVSSDSLEEKKKTKISDFEYDSENSLLENNTFLASKDLSLVETTDLLERTCVLEDSLKFKNKELIDDHVASEERHPDHSTTMKQILGSLTFIPIEPEWEEDDIYLIHRKDATRMMRSASRYSKVANDSYLRGDHLSAQQFSQKAREEWKAAEMLNAKAAKEILCIRNCKNDVWKLDLHGLHAAEAVDALQDHLHKIESQVPYFAPSPNRVNTTADMVRSVSLESLSRMDREKVDKQQASYRHRPTLLEVITGKGNHSRGQAALPRAIETFLSENGYHYDQARPGVITVRPKFRRQ